MTQEITWQDIDLPGGPLRVGQLAEAAELPDDAAIEWAPIVPYWSVLWRSGVELAREVDEAGLAGKRVLELGSGMGVPGLAGARGGAEVTATDLDPQSLALLRDNAAANELELETVVADWAAPAALTGLPRFDVVLASDVLYERQHVALLLDLLPRLGSEAWLADPGRSPAEAFFERARERWDVETTERGVASIHRIRFPHQGS